MSITDDLTNAITSTTQKWTKQRKAEERRLRSRGDREHMYSDRVRHTDVVDEILPDAYAHASGGGAYPVSKRQLYYASREEFRRRTGREITYNYFGPLLVKYRNRNPEAEEWRITADPRGTLTIPHAGYDVHVPCGTLEIEAHLSEATQRVDPYDVDVELPIEWPSLAGGQRYQAVLYIEKEGFGPILDAAQIAERFDLAILSNKGQSVVAARRFVDEVCRVDGGVPLFVVHDFDKYGFEIAARLTSVSLEAMLADRVAYHFENKIQVTDLGLRLTDVEEYGLADETVEFKGGFAADSVCSDEEMEFLRSGRRVELNAFTSPQFIEWIEGKLTEHGLSERLIPDDAVLERAYRRALVTASINSAVAQARQDAVDRARSAKLPKGLKHQMQKRMEESSVPWDKALYELAKSKLSRARRK